MGWAERKTRSIREASSLCEEGGWLFLGSCVELNGQLINHINDDAIEMTLRKFEQDIDLSSFKEVMGYDADLPLEQDQHISYWRSNMPADHSLYPGSDVLFLDHSRIEYVWVHVRGD